MRTPFIAGNWKMNKTISEALELVRKLKYQIVGVKSVKVAVCPPFTALKSVYEVIKDTNIYLGAQNMWIKESGAYTGEVSPVMLKDCGCTYVIIGHSERRAYFKEDDSLVSEKIKVALKHNLLPIVCVGEVLEERESGKAYDVVKTQVLGAFEGISKEDILKVTIAYEPVWAIGTGKTATPEDANSMHRFIREVLSQIYDDEVAQNMIIQYGGSVKPENIKGLMAMPEIDGALVGGASLDAESFAKIVKFDSN